ncbi:MarR family winged helix-turn-helix transcriptional regulator [Paenibacillus sp. NFR01]|uniref:MarR family winged helix-turn-helix transcriptional regulator n=1 Tax=Paenibacillus sp. NFR01 TaxID=1566279 RepID=UPI0008B5151E|nr:MarR family transcriptional regulator [Paenibacillus sp. NFR01]SET40353.1 DNA-binding transcriptional regulator, MarR family [Paenibacillus sp. NFR01]
MEKAMGMPEQQAFILGGMLTLANRLQVLGDKLDEHMTMKQWLLIAVILKSGSPAPALSDLAALFGSSRQNVKKMLQLLENRGFVALAKDPQDARVLRVRLTEHCHRYFLARQTLEEHFMEALFKDFDAELTGALYRGLHKLTGNVAQMEHDNLPEGEE